MNNFRLNPSPSFSAHLNDLAINTNPDTKKDGRCDAPINRFFSGRSVSSCNPLEDLTIEGKYSYDHQQLKPKKQKLTINSKKVISKKSTEKKKLINSIIISAKNSSTHSRKSWSIIQPPLSQTKNDELLKKREKERIRKARYRATEQGKLSARKASAKYRSSEKGKEKRREYQENYNKTPKGIISSTISNAKSNTTVSALKKGHGMKEARTLGIEAAEDKKAEWLEALHMLQTQPEKTSILNPAKPR